MSTALQAKLARITRSTWDASEFQHLDKKQLLQVHHWMAPEGIDWLDAIGKRYYIDEPEMAVKNAFRNFILALTKGPVAPKKMTTCVEDYAWMNKQNFFAEKDRLVVNFEGDAKYIKGTPVPCLDDLRAYSNVITHVVASYCSHKKNSVVFSPEHATSFTYQNSPVVMHHFHAFAGMIDASVQEYAPYLAMSENEKNSLTGLRWINFVTDFMAKCDLSIYMYLQKAFIVKLLKIGTKRVDGQMVPIIPKGGVVDLVGMNANMNPSLVAASDFAVQQFGGPPQVVSTKLQVISGTPVPKADPKFKVAREIVQSASTRMSSKNGAVQALSKGFGFVGVPTDNARNMHLTASIVLSELLAGNTLSVVLDRTDVIIPLITTMKTRASKEQCSKLKFVVPYNQRSDLGSVLDYLVTAYVIGSKRLILFYPRDVTLPAESDDAKYNELCTSQFKSALGVDHDDKGPAPKFIMFANVIGVYPFEQKYHVYRYGFTTGSNAWKSIVSSDPLELVGYEGTCTGGKVQEKLVKLVSEAPQTSDKFVQKPFRKFVDFGSYCREVVRETAQVESIGFFPRVNYSPIVNVVRLDFKGLTITEDGWSFDGAAKDEVDTFENYSHPDPAVGQEKKDPPAAGTTADVLKPVKSKGKTYAEWRDMGPEGYMNAAKEGVPDELIEDIEEAVGFYATLHDGHALEALATGADFFALEASDVQLTDAKIPWMWKGLAHVAEIRGVTFPKEFPVIEDN